MPSPSTCSSLSTHLLETYLSFAPLKLLFRMLRRFPMFAQFFVEFRPTLFREEKSGVFELDAASSARNVVCKPMRPFHVEEDVIRSPHDQRRCLQAFQPGFNSECVLIVESGEKTLEIVSVLVGSDEWKQIAFDAFVT